MGIYRTEDARDKWCPFGIPAQDKADRAFSGDGDGEATDSDGDPYSSRNYGNRCIVENCMAWRWTNDGEKTHGYCGIAGQP